MQNQSSPLILSFGVTDPVGAVGIQADLACYAAMGCHGLSAVTGVLFGDTTQVEDIQPIDADWVADQARILLEDMPVAAFKVGCTASAETVAVLAEIVSDYPDLPLILDPFTSNLPELGDEAEEWLAATRELLVPQATLLMLSRVELGLLAETWRDPSTDDLMADDVARLIQSGCEYVLVTDAAPGTGEFVNTLFDSEGPVRDDRWPRQPGNFMGAGATVSAAIAALVANGMDVPEAVREAQEFNAATLAHAQRLGMGRLVPDRFFWAREAGIGAPEDGANTLPGPDAEGAVRIPDGRGSR